MNTYPAILVREDRNGKHKSNNKTMKPYKTLRNLLVILAIVITNCIMHTPLHLLVTTLVCIALVPVVMDLDRESKQ